MRTWEEKAYVTSRKIYQNKSRAKNNSQNFFIVELRLFPPDLSKTGPDIRIHRHPISLFAPVPCVTPDRRACASGRGRRRESLSLSFSFSFSFSFFLFFFLPLLSLSPSSLSSLPRAPERRSAPPACTQAAPGLPLAPCSPAPQAVLPSTRHTRALLPTRGPRCRATCRAARLAARR